MSTTWEDLKPKVVDNTDRPSVSTDTTAKAATTAALSVEAIDLPSRTAAATVANLATDVDKNEEKTVTASKGSSKVSNLSFKIAASTTRSGLVRKAPVIKRSRVNTKPKGDSNGNDHNIIWSNESQNILSVATTATSSATSNANIVTSRISALTISGTANNNDAQHPSIISSSHNSFLPAASNSIMFDTQPNNAIKNITAINDNRNNITNQNSTVNLQQSTVLVPRINHLNSVDMLENANTNNSGLSAYNIFYRPSYPTALSSAFNSTLNYNQMPGTYNYIQSTERCGFTEQENLIRLQKCLKGAALEVARGKLMMPSTVKFAIETLRMLYGRPEIIHQTLQKNLRNEPTVRKERLDTLINFALAVQNYRTTLQAMGLSDYLNDPMLLNELVEKLPADLKLDWSRYRMTLQRVDIVCFDTWLFNLAACAAQVTTFSPYVSETKNLRKERILIHDVIDKDKSNSQLVLCSKCNNNHRLFECSEFTAMSVNERWKFIREKSLCLRCFKKHHLRRCNSKRQCGVDGCKLPHNSLLHKNNVIQQQRQDQNSTNQAILFHAEEKVLFKYIPVTLFANGYTLNTYALIDEGASCPLIESELADQLGLDGPTSELCLQWTSKITQKEEKSKTYIESKPKF